MNSHALGVLEFPRVLELVAARASSEVGARRVRALTPRGERAWVEREHARVTAVRALVADEGGWAPEPVPDLDEPLARLRIAGVAWTGVELLAGATLLRSSRRTREALREDRRPAVARAVLAPLADRLVTAQKAEETVGRAIADDGLVRDGASPLLARLRRDLRGAEGELVRLLERVAGGLDAQHQVSDGSVTMRNGRFVIPIRREARTTVGGIVHDTSSTGATLFVEPPAAIEAGNRIRELESEERREVERVLRELTDALRPLREAMLDSLDALTELDALYARARYAVDFGCAAPELGDPAEGFHVRDGRHPLLLAQGIAVVPFELEMLPGERTLLISGPNTGGKTVLLKSVGLFSAMVQAGVPAPVGAESRIALFDEILADVGDEQSIAASLSTFSAHVKNLGEILTRATAQSLVLVDELGSGTDPLEGAALGGAILEALTRRGTMTLATTHLGALKDLATEVPGIVNASLQFDVALLAPTYRLIKGVPGRSYGLSIARRLALPEDVLTRAEERVPRVERDVDALLADLERRDAALGEREQRAEEAIAGAEERFGRVEARERAVREREREVERRARLDAREYVLRARREVEQAIADLRAQADIAGAAGAARRRIEQLAAEHGQELAALDREHEQRDAPGSMGARGDTLGARRLDPLSPGQWVEVETLGGRMGQVVDVRDDEAVVAVGAVKLTVPLRAVRRTARGAPAESVPVSADVPDVAVSSEIDLRGLRVDEAEERVMRALDDAVRADLPSLRVIHGKGTGALRQRVSEMLQKDTRVKAFRLGAWNEGGAGVTVAELA
jgi:DNA mismatch repair protein MutS2